MSFSKNDGGYKISFNKYCNCSIQVMSYYCTLDIYLCAGADKFNFPILRVCGKIGLSGVRAVVLIL